MSMEEIYTQGVAEENQLVLRERNLAQVERRYNELTSQLVRRENAVANNERQLEQRTKALAAREKTLKQDQDAQRRRETEIQNRLVELDRQRHVMEAERDELRRQQEHTKRMEEQRRLRRSPSEAYLEDAFPTLIIPDIVKLIGNPSARIRRQAMQTLSPLSDLAYARQHQRDFDAIILALLPTARPLLAFSKEDVLEFVAAFLKEKHVDLALARANQCPNLLDLLSFTDARVTSLAFDALCNILAGDIHVRRPLRIALDQQLRTTNPLTLSFIARAVPRSTEDVLSDGIYPVAVAYATHPSVELRSATYGPLLRVIGTAVAVRRGLVHENLIVNIHNLVQHSDVPADLADFAAKIIPRLAIEIAHENQLTLLLDMVCCKDQGLQTSCVLALRTIRQVDSVCLEALRVALDAHIWSHDTMNTRIHALVLESMQPIALDLLRTSKFVELLTYLDLEDGAIREVALDAIMSAAQDSSDLQRKLLDAGLLAKMQPYFVMQDPPQDILNFAVRMLPSFAIQICRAGSTAVLMELLLHPNAAITQATLGGLRKILHCDKRCRQALQYALEPYLGTPPPKILVFAAEALPLITTDVMLDNRHAEIMPLLAHESRSLRGAVMPTVLQVTQSSAAQQKHLVNGGIMKTILPYLQSTRPPDDIVHFANTLLPLLAVYLAEAGFTPQLIELLGNPSVRQTAADCLRKIAAAGEHGQRILVEADILPKLIQQLSAGADAVISLLCDLLPVLSLLWCRKKQASSLIQLVGATNTGVSSRSLAGIKAIVGSSKDDRALLSDALLPQLGAQEHVLSVVDVALPAITKDFVAAGDLSQVIEFAMNAEVRIRQAAYPALREAIRDSAPSRQALVDLGFFPVLVGYCASPVKDRVQFAVDAIPLLAMEACRSGWTSKLLELFNIGDNNVRQALYSSLLLISRGNALEQRSLMDANIMGILSNSMRQHRQAELSFFEQLLPNLAQRIAENSESCAEVLGFLADSHPSVRNAATRTLDNILSSSPDDRRLLREAVYSQLNQSAAPAVSQYASKALTTAFCADYMRDENYRIIFDLLSHRAVEVRLAVETQLQGALRSQATSERLAAAGLFQVLLSLLPAASADIMSFTAEHAIPALGPFLVEGEPNCSTLIGLLTHGQKSIRQGAGSGLRKAANTSVALRHKLVEADLVPRLVSSLDFGDPVMVELTCALLPILAIEIAQADLCDTLLDLLSHPTIPVRRAANEALQNILVVDAISSHLVKPLLGRSEQLREHEVIFFGEAIIRLNETIILLGEEKRLIQLLWHEIPSVSESTFEAVRTLVVKGSSFDRNRLLEGQLFSQLIQLLKTSRLRASAIILTLDVLPSLTPSMVETGQFDQMLPLFSDPEPQIAVAIDASLRQLSGNPSQRLQIVYQDVVSQLFNHLALVKDNRILSLACFLCQALALPLVDLGKAQTLVGALIHREAEVRWAAVQAILTATTGATESVKSTLALTEGLLPGFLHVLATDNTRHAMVQAICDSLSNLASGSINRAKLILASGIAPALVDLCQTPHIEIQTSSLNALNALCSSSLGEKTTLIRTGILRVLVRLLEEPPSPRVAHLALTLLVHIASVRVHRADICQSDVLRTVVRYIRPSDEVERVAQVNQTQALEVCRFVASETDQERRALLDAGALPPLVQLTQHSRSEVVVLACSTIEAIGRSGTFRQEMINAEVPKYLKRRTSLMRKTSLAAGENKKPAQVAAKQALQTLETGLLSGLGRKLTRKGTQDSSSSSRHHRAATEPMNGRIPEED